MTGPYMGGKYASATGFNLRLMGDRLRPLWDFDDVDGSEKRFQAQLDQEESEAGRAEVMTQLARAHGLRGRFADGDRMLDEARSLAGPSAIAGIRIQLERGRLRRSSGDAASALPLFETAYALAVEAGEAYLAVDAAHMAALAAPDRAGKLAWTDRGVRIAAGSPDRQVQYWLAPLYNNLGGEYMDAGEHEAALDAFQKALESRERYPEVPEMIEHAKQSVEEARSALGR
jgi:tetratricopeptide (TPR) repeat protein